jgi:hypothetical protein
MWTSGFRGWERGSGRPSFSSLPAVQLAAQLSAGQRFRK